MSTALISTTTVSRPAIGDLACDSNPRPARPSIHSKTTVPISVVGDQEHLASSSHRPPKRRRVETRALGDVLRHHVKHHILTAVNTLDPDIYDTKTIAEKAIITVATDNFFKERQDETGGWFTKDDETKIADLVWRLVGEVCEQPDNRLPRPPPPQPPPPLLDDEDPEELDDNATHNDTNQHPESPPPNKPPESLPRKSEPLISDTDSVKSSWFQLTRRPYETAANRERIRRGIRLISSEDVEPQVYHVDFTPQEIAHIVDYMCDFDTPLPPTLESLKTLLDSHYHIPQLLGDGIRGRTRQDILNLCSDILSGSVTDPSKAQILRISVEDTRKTSPSDRNYGRIPALLWARELEGGMMGFVRTRRLVNFQNEFKTCIEDQLEKVAEFTNCAGDIATLSWVSQKRLICGTTTHSDAHNQQYNKPGNLLIYSGPKLQALPDHRRPRPYVHKGDNSSHAMRQSQDPWMYSSVVSSDYDPENKLAYTSSFDGTVKVWKVNDDGMKCLATWRHNGNVNFVCCATDGSGRVATATDTPREAVRIYKVDPDNISNKTPYESFSCQRQDAVLMDKWAYYPAAMRWGITPGTQHILAVGYSPRGREDEFSIPDDKEHTGEVALWDAEAGCRIPLTTPVTANVFEICWHPFLKQFIVATSPYGLVEHSARTQLHFFGEDRDKPGAFCEFQDVDCMASDINELTIMPNSLVHSYVTAACTNGRVYIWDSAQNHNSPIHVLEHGVSLEGFEEEHVEKLDTGVKFTAWGSTPDRFYTGGSDGVVKVWNVRHTTQPFIRTLLEAPAPVSAGAFSPDMSRLAIGDASGRLTIFSIDPTDAPEAKWITINGRKIQQPHFFTPHPALNPPTSYTSEEIPNESANTDMNGIVNSPRFKSSSGAVLSKMYLNSNQLRLTGNRAFGVVQGPQYESANIYRREAHENGDPSRPLLPVFERQQRASIDADRGARRRSMRRLDNPGVIAPPSRALRCHHVNTDWETSVGELDSRLMDELVRDGAVLSLNDEDWDLEYESGDEC